MPTPFFQSSYCFNGGLKTIRRPPIYCTYTNFLSSLKAFVLAVAGMVQPVHASGLERGDGEPKKTTSKSLDLFQYSLNADHSVVS